MPYDTTDPAQALHHERILNDLREQQHMFPHEPVRQLLQAIAERNRLASACVELALQRSGLEPHQSTGRLREDQILGLADAICSAWQQDLHDRASVYHHR